MSTPTSVRSPASGVSALPGCYIFSLLAVLVAGTLIWAGYTFFHQVGELKAFTDPSPVVLAVVEPAPAQIEDLTRRLGAFEAATLDGRAAELTLSVDDLNALLAGFPRLAAIKPLLRFRRLGPDATFTADISFPMNSRPGRRRHLNGEIDGRFGLHPEAGLFISVLDVRVPGRTVPPGFVEVYQRGIIPGKNFGFLDDTLIRNFRDDQKFAEPLRRIASLQSQEGQITLSTERRSGAGSAEPTPRSPVPSPADLPTARKND